LKDIAPSDKLRKWFSHKEERWKEFRIRYKEKLKTKKELLEKIRKLEKEYGTVSLLFSARILNTTMQLYC